MSTEKLINFKKIDFVYNLFFLNSYHIALDGEKMLHNAPLSDLSSIVLFLNKPRKTDHQNEMIFELI